MQALIFAAGLGTRLRPLTDTMPKALVPVTCSYTGETRPMINWLLPKLHFQGFDSIVINVHHLAPQLISHVQQYYIADEAWNTQLTFSDESDMLLNTGGGIKKALAFLDPSEPFLVHNVDIVSNVNLNTFYKFHNPSSLATILVSERKTARQLIFNEDNRLLGWTNLETGEVRSLFPDLDMNKCKLRAFSGIHVISPAVAKAMTSWPKVFSIVDFYLAMAAKAEIIGYEPKDLHVKDLGKLDALYF